MIESAKDSGQLPWTVVRRLPQTMGSERAVFPLVGWNALSNWLRCKSQKRRGEFIGRGGNAEEIDCERSLSLGCGRLMSEERFFCDAQASVSLKFAISDIRCPSAFRTPYQQGLRLKCYRAPMARQANLFRPNPNLPTNRDIYRPNV